MKTALRKVLPMLLCLILCICFIPAAWAESTYTIRFDANGGYGEMYAITFNEGETGVLDPNNFSRANYVFSHWNTKADGSGISYADQGDITPTDSITLYAQWVKTFYSVNYNKNGGGGVMPSGSVQKYRSGTVKECAFNPPTYYTVFTEWNTSPDGTGTSYRPGDPIWSDDTPNDITLYAIWREKLDVWFYPGEGSGTATSVEEPKGSEVRLPTPANLGFTAPDGQTFAGWMIDGEYRLYKAGEYYAFDSAKMVTAIWTNSIRLSYDPNGGTLRTSAGTFSTARSWTIPKNTEYTLYTADQLKLTRDGYQFEGWMSTASGSTVKYTDGQIIDEGFSQNTTIYAKWKRVKIADTATISGSVTGSDPNAVWGETLTAMVVDPVFKTGFTYTWKVGDVAVQMGESNMFEVLPEYYGREITCTVTHPQAENEVVSNIKTVGVYAVEEDGELRIVNSRAKYPGLYYEVPFIFGVMPGTTYYKDGKAATVPESAASGAFEITEPGVYVFGDTTYVATQWWTIGYSRSNGSGDNSGSGTTTMKRGSTTLSGTTRIKSGDVTLLEPFKTINGYNSVWLVRDGSGITDITLTVRPSASSSVNVSRNGSTYNSSNTEQIISLGSVMEPEMYEIVFTKTASSPRTDIMIILPSALTEISDEAFSGGAFSSVVIPESVTKIGSRAFADCPNLQYVQILGPTIDIAPDAFENVDGLTVYYKFSSALTRVDAQALGCAFVQMP